MLRAGPWIDDVMPGDPADEAMFRKPAHSAPTPGAPSKNSALCEHMHGIPHEGIIGAYEEFWFSAPQLPALIALVETELGPCAASGARLVDRSRPVRAAGAGAQCRRDLRCERVRGVLPKRSAGILMYKREGGALQVLLVHPGGPFWATKDDGAWSIRKGEYDADEAPLAAAQREFAEELGSVPRGECRTLGEVKQRGGKIVTGFALEGDLDVGAIRSSVFEMK